MTSSTADESPLCMYSQRNIRLIHEEKYRSQSLLETRLLNMLQIQGHLTRLESRVFLTEGVCRRLKTIRRCVEQIFEIFPPEREDLLTGTELTDVVIPLHAFFMNIFGFLDNLAWILVFEKNLESTLDRNRVGLYSRDMTAVLSKNFRAYLRTEKIRHWHNTHLKDSRDALAHRIPPYIPVYSEVLDKGIKIPSAVYCQSLTHGKNPTRLHPQVIADSNTVAEVVEKFLAFEFIS